MLTHPSVGAPKSLGAWLNWESTGLQNRRLQVRVLSPLRSCRAVREESAVTATRTDSPGARPSKGRGGAPTRFVRESVSEMRKVLWPSRNELVTYAIVVIIFVVIMTAIVAGLDFGFAKLVLQVLG